MFFLKKYIWEILLADIPGWWPSLANLIQHYSLVLQFYFNFGQNPILLQMILHQSPFLVTALIFSTFPTRSNKIGAENVSEDLDWKKWFYIMNMAKGRGGYSLLPNLLLCFLTIHLSRNCCPTFAAMLPSCIDVFQALAKLSQRFFQAGAKMSSRRVPRLTCL